MKLKNEIVSNFLDTQTGELLEITTEKVFSIKVESESFYMTFVKMIAPIYKLKSISDLKILIKFCEICEFNTGKVYISSNLRKEICNELNISTNSFSISIKSLIEKNLILGEKGSYLLNPLIFWKGSIKDRNSLIKDNIIEFSFKIT